MFARTDVVRERHTVSSGTARVQRPIAAKPRTSDVRTCNPSLSSSRSVSRAAGSTDTSVSERYSNRTYNRQPSPPGRFVRPFSANKGERLTSKVPVDRPRERLPLSSHYSRVQQTVNQAGNNVKLRTLEAGCLEQAVQQRPRSSFRKRVVTVEPPRSESATSLNNHKVLIALKDVLSRAVIEKGKIDEENIGNILKDMKSRLFCQGNQEEEDFPANIEVEGKESKTIVNINKSNENIPVKRTKAIAGIVRRNLGDNSGNSIQNSYKKIYSKRISSGPKTIKEMPDGTSIVYIDLPDADYSNFDAIVRKDRERLRDSQCKKEPVKQDEEEPLEKEESSCADEIVGDCQLKDECSSLELWKAAEDAKLQSYIESLVRNMHEQLSGKKPLQSVDDETEGKNSTCQSFCVCKVCLSNKESKHILPEEPFSTESNKTVNLSEDAQKSNDEKVTPNQNRNKLHSKRSTTQTAQSNFRVLKQNKIIQPDSKVNINSRPTSSQTPRNGFKQAPASKESYTVVEPGQTEEAGDDMYLKRRIRAVSRRR